MPVLSLSVPLGNRAWRSPFERGETTLAAPELAFNRNARCTFTLRGWIAIRRVTSFG